VVRIDAAHQVVRGRADRNRIRREVQSDLPAHVGDCRKAFAHVHGEVRKREKHLAAGPLGLAHDAAGDDVAGSEIAVRMIAGHERLAGGVHQARAFATHSLGNQEARRSGMAQRGRMELDEFEIRDAGACMVRQRNAVAGRDRRIRRFAKDLSGAAGREQGGAGADLAPRAVVVEIDDAANRRILNDEAGDECVVDRLDRSQCLDAMPQRAADFAAGRIAGVKNAPNGVRGLEAESGEPALVSIEAGSPLEKLTHVLWPIVDEDAHRCFVAQAIAGTDCVGGVQRRTVAGADGCRNTALRVARVALGRIGFRENQYAAFRRKRDGGAETGDAAADYDEVKGFDVRGQYRSGVILTSAIEHNDRRRNRRNHSWLLRALRVLRLTWSRMVRIEVDTPSRRYAITLDQAVLDLLPRVLDEVKAPARRFVVSSPVVWRFHGARLAKAGIGEPILVPDGERYKQLQTVSRVYESLIRANADRASTLLTFGGGVIGDMAGFAAATYLRGIALVHVPTTLLAQVDASIGGKVGVNHALGKNLIGAFYQPHAVIIDLSVLGTLPRREFRAGLYEVIKYGMTSSPPLFDRIARDRSAIFARDPEILSSVVAESCRIKAAVVSADEREAGPRRVLNFGHTAGHALEAVTKYRRYRHGEAVAYGMLVAAELAVLRGALAASDRTALADLVASLGPLPPIADITTREMFEAMQHDKKMIAGRLHFVLPTAVGATTIVDDVTEKEMKAALVKVGFKR
jgi:3-dehydroquinate synthase